MTPQVKEIIDQLVDEKSVSVKQQRFMGMVHAAQKSGKPASPAVAKVAKEMKKKDAKDFASTKHKGLPTKVKESGNEMEEIDPGDILPPVPEGKMRIMVLNDGETWTNLEGCKILDVPNDVDSDDVKYYISDENAFVKGF